jgi:dienelactone hydrolase
VARGWKYWTLRRWLYPGLGIAAVAAAATAIWLAALLLAQKPGPKALRSSSDVTVQNRTEVLALLPVSGRRRTALIFLCGSAVDARAYAVLLRPVAKAGYPVFVVRLPFRQAPPQAHRPIIFARIRRVIADHPESERWVLSGHSLGAALSVLFAHAEPRALAGLVLIATNHPTDADLTSLEVPVSQIYATHDGMVASADVLAASKRLPPHTRQVEIKGGNHARFGRYGEKGIDGKATISREQQEALTRAEIIRLLAEVDSRR